MGENPSEPGIDSNNCQGRIRWLVAAHVAVLCGVLAIQRVWRLSGVDLAGSLEFAQVTLLGIWFGIGRGRWQRRLLKSFACVVVVAGGKETLAAVALLGAGWAFLIEIVCLQAMLTATAWITAAGGTIAAKKWGPKLKLVKDVQSHADRSPQFSIRNLFVAMLVTGAVLAIVRLIRANFDAQQVNNLVLAFLLITPMVAIYCSAAAVAYVWAGLGVSHLPLRITAAAILQLALTLLLSIAFSQKWEPQTFATQLIVQLLEAFVVIGSLLVVRSCGFRVVSRSAEPAAQVSNSLSAPHPLD